MEYEIHLNGRFKTMMKFEIPCRIGELIELPSDDGAEIFIIDEIVNKSNGVILYVILVPRR
jgi:hypothetical protein